MAACALRSDENERALHVRMQCLAALTRRERAGKEQLGARHHDVGRELQQQPRRQLGEVEEVVGLRVLQLVGEALHVFGDALHRREILERASVVAVDAGKRPVQVRARRPPDSLQALGVRLFVATQRARNPLEGLEPRDDVVAAAAERLRVGARDAVLETRREFREAVGVEGRMETAQTRARVRVREDAHVVAQARLTIERLNDDGRLVCVDVHQAEETVRRELVRVAVLAEAVAARGAEVQHLSVQRAVRDFGHLHLRLHDKLGDLGDGALYPRLGPKRPRATRPLATRELAVHFAPALLPHLLEDPLWVDELRL